MNHSQPGNLTQPRRRFLGLTSTSLSAAGLALSTRTCLHGQTPSAASPARVVVGVMGLSRGLALAKDFMKVPGVELRYVCDVDAARVASGVKALSESVQPVTDFRAILDDPAVDALVCAAPNHWHGPAAILGCKAGKHVYVEKPACHNPQEGEWMVAAAQKYQRCVQVGTQRRSCPGILEAIAKLHQGVIGRVYLSRAFFDRFRGSIGVTQPSNPPNNLDYDLWQGPAPRRPFKENVVPYNWHWFWHWGNGELGNNGIHALDVCRWGLQVDYPIRTVSSGGRYGFDDDQETPDIQQVAWEFEGKKQITYQGSSLTKTSLGPFLSFYGTEGYMEIGGDGSYRILDPNHKVLEEKEKTTSGQAEHIANFVEAVRQNNSGLLAQPILSGHQSTLLCHLGNIAHRTDRVIHTRASDGHLLDKEIPADLWQREYDPQWVRAVSEI